MRQVGRVCGFLFIDRLNIKGIQGNTTLCRDTRKGNVVAMLKNRPGHAEQQPDVVRSLHLDDRPLQGQFVVDVDLWRDGGLKDAG